MRKYFIVFLFVFFGLISQIASARTIETECEYISNCTFETGSIKMTPEGKTINPYHSNFAAIALTLSDNFLTDHQDTVKNYFKWYIAHLNKPDKNDVNCTIYDYKIEDGQEVSKDIMDSTDSYAATFLSLAYSFVKNGGSSDFVKGYKDNLRCIAESIEATLSPQDLTYAKPDYHIAYLMDNSEVYAGFRDYVKLLQDENTLNDPETADYYLDLRDRIGESIEELLWNSESEEYIIAYGESPPNWEEWYPDATANVWPCLFELPQANPERCQKLFKKLLDYHPTWLNGTADTSGFPWCSINNVAISVSENSTANDFNDWLVEHFDSTNWEYPYYCGEAGWRISYLNKWEKQNESSSDDDDDDDDTVSSWISVYQEEA
ncbi:hypothetical protein M0813_13062 [Anaeramoeba flamelloides]|uniref:Uncharacterized protein n=1 Tax=Anaeramoeba flamelloides TaxID=1746091 RepID=A0ABQ8ZA41_9EUKA|nr:hypothetical protein M0813_13062 [Anaeramoeba flamelloides]